jgi:hypothetical protein
MGSPYEYPTLENIRHRHDGIRYQSPVPRSGRSSLSTPIDNTLDNGVVAGALSTHYDTTSMYHFLSHSSTSSLEWE